MAQETIDEIIRKKQAEKSAAAPPAAESPQEDKFFSILIGDNFQENFLELQTRDGLRTCFPYSDIIWMAFDPESGLSIDFGGFWVLIKGRGLAGKLFQGLKQKRVAWVKEADHELQDHKENEIYISEITITPPKDFTEQEEQTAE